MKKNKKGGKTEQKKQMMGKEDLFDNVFSVLFFASFFPLCDPFFTICFPFRQPSLPIITF